MLARRLAHARRAQLCRLARPAPAHFSTTAHARQATPAPEIQRPNLDAIPSSDAARSSSPVSAATAPIRPERKSRFHLYSPNTASPLTRLPMPLPPDVAQRSASLRTLLDKRANWDTALDTSKMSFDDLTDITLSRSAGSIFPNSSFVEEVGLLKACLKTELISRAHKLFTSLRRQATATTAVETELRQRLAKEDVDGHLSRQILDQLDNSTGKHLDIGTYNSMLRAYMRKAFQADLPEVTREWLDRFWDLWRDMMRSIVAARNTRQISADPAPDAASFAYAFQGLVALQNDGRYPDNAHSLEALVQDLTSSGIRLQSVLTSTAFKTVENESSGAQGRNEFSSDAKINTGQMDANSVLSSISDVAENTGNDRLKKQLNTMRSILDGRKLLESVTPRESPMSANPLEEAPELRPVLRRSGKTDQSPYNLDSLKKNLSVVQEARKTVEDPYERQMLLEQRAMDSAKEKLEHNARMEPGLVTDKMLLRKTTQVWMWKWYNDLRDCIKADLARFSDSSDNVDKAMQTRYKHLSDGLLPFLRLLTPDKLALLTVLELMRLSGAGQIADGMKTAHALVRVGKAVEDEYASRVAIAKAAKDKKLAVARKYFDGNGLLDFEARKDYRNLEQQVDARSEDLSLPAWTQDLRVQIGSYLTENLIRVAQLRRKATDADGVVWEEDQPAFYSTYQYVSGKRLGVIKLNEELARRLDKDSLMETLQPRHLPMLVPPKPWTSHNSGGYYYSRQLAMRYKDSAEQISYLEAACEDGNVDSVLAGLDVLGNTCWVINKPVFDVVTQVWNSGETLADMPPPEIDEAQPKKPDNHLHDRKARSVYIERIKQWHNRKNALHSQRSEINYRLEIARTYLGERMYFPHNMDFRGRAYPIPPNLNHMGDDLSRGLLTFAEGKTLGKVGLRWLRIHLANVYGYDKASFEERVAFAITHEADIRDSAENPLAGNRWWLNAGNPWQCLATCFEYAAAMKHPDGPEAYSSNLHVHQDGTCNGLQHYAALGGDMAGAKQVNLAQGDRPADVYTTVADLAIATLEEDAKHDHPFASVLKGKVTRKVVKQTVMTTVYGVTFVGAKNQVMKQLADRGDIPAEHLYHTSSYLARIILSSIGNLFSGAESIQKWLQLCAKLISKSIPPHRVTEALRLETAAGLKIKKNLGISGKYRATEESESNLAKRRMTREQMSSVIWTTALGLPIVQPYRKPRKRQVMTSMQTVYIEDPLAHAEVSSVKQAGAFPPNFIHSLDATHMFLTALECHSAGLTFAAVHDSYWTHACDVETMSDLIRQTFVRLHSQDILHRLREEFLERYKGHKVPVSAVSGRKHRSVNDTLHMVTADEVSKFKGKTAEVTVDLSGTADVEEADESHDSTRETAEGAFGGHDGESVEESSPERQGLRQKEQAFQAKLVDLADLLPPIPERGSFDVNEIRNSLYFFC